MAQIQIGIPVGSIVVKDPKGNDLIQVDGKVLAIVPLYEGSTATTPDQLVAEVRIHAMLQMMAMSAEAEGASNN